MPAVSVSSGAMQSRSTGRKHLRETVNLQRGFMVTAFQMGKNKFQCISEYMELRGKQPGYLRNVQTPQSNTYDDLV